MEEKIQFKSSYYKPVFFKNTLLVSAKKIEKIKKHIVIFGENGFLLSTGFIANLNETTIFSKTIPEGLKNFIFKKTDLAFQSDWNLLIYKSSVACTFSDKVNPYYFLLIKNIVNELINDSFDIYKYTYDHLSCRKFDGKIITSIESVNNEFLEILIKLQHVQFQKESLDENTVSFLLNEIVFVLHRLAYLGGARSLLKNNVIQYIASIKFFSKFIVGEKLL